MTSAQHSLTSIKTMFKPYMVMIQQKNRETNLFTPYRPLPHLGGVSHSPTSSQTLVWCWRGRCRGRDCSFPRSQSTGPLHRTRPHPQLCKYWETPRLYSPCILRALARRYIGLYLPIRNCTHEQISD